MRRMTLKSLLTRTLLGMQNRLGSQNLLEYGLYDYGIPLYPSNLTPEQYLELYEYCGLATRIVDSYPNECWKRFPLVREGDENGTTDFEKQWKVLTSRPDLSLPFNLLTADRISGVGRFGILFLGFSDGKKMDQEVTEADSLLFVRPFCEPFVSVDPADLNKNESNPRYGLPEYYRIKFSTSSNSFQETKVHYSRVLHLSENTLRDKVFGRSRLFGLVPRVLDVSLLLSGSTHMFMRGGFPGYAFEADEDVELQTEDKESMKEQIDDYVHSMSRYLTLQGVKAKALDVQVANPEPHIRAQLQYISITTGIPLRLLIGSEQAQLASSQDRTNFDERVSARQEYYLTPSVVLPLITSLQKVGVLPPTEEPIHCQWIREDLNALVERSKVSVTLAEAIQRYADNPFAMEVFPIRSFLSIVLGLTPEQMDKILEEMDEQEVVPIPPEEDVLPEGDAE